MSQTEATPADQALVSQPLSAQELVHVLSTHALQKDGAGSTVGLVHLRDCLSVLEPCSSEVNRLIHRAIRSLESAGEALTPVDKQALSQSGALEIQSLPLHDDLQAFMRAMFRRYEEGFLVWKPAEGLPDPLQAIYGPLHQALDRQVSGQFRANEEASRLLAIQLASPQRQLPARVFLSGPEGAGARQMAQAIGAHLSADGYALCEIELSRISSNDYVIILCGGQAQWSGARPGELTAHGHKHPKSVFLLHDLHLAAPRAQQELCRALRSGFMKDEYGFDTVKRNDRHNGRGSEPTEVNLSQAVFVFTTSGGQQDLWRNPDVVEMLQSGQDAVNDIREAVMSAQRSAVRNVRGGTAAAFEPDLLPVLEQDMVILVPQDWNNLTSHAARCISQAMVAAEQQFGITLHCDSATLKEVAVLTAASFGGHGNFDRITPESVGRVLFTSLAEARVDQGWAGHQAAPTEVKLVIEAAASARAHQLLQDLGHDPIRLMQRRKKAMRFDVQMLPTGVLSTWTLSISQPRMAKTKDWADYRGDMALTAVVPETSFSAIAGQPVAKAHLREIIDLYRQADALRARGVELPRGCVLCGPPGTGKTMLAQAFAAEADMAFIAVSGSDLLQPERVKELFTLARSNAPSVLFVDEIDALGKRGQSSGLHDAAINHLLSLIQGFDQRAPVYVLAATNRPHLLDEALTRPGRLDRSIFVGALDRKGREPQLGQLLDLLPPLADGRDQALQHLLNLSHAMTGADLAHTLRECTLLKMRRGCTGLGLSDLVEQLNRRRHGDRSQDPRESELHERTATHEAGHAVLHCLWFPEYPIEQVTAIARADAEGFVAISAEEAIRISETGPRVLQYMAVLMGGRAAEIQRYGKTAGPSSGCGNDFAKARLAAFKAVAHQGLDEVWGTMSMLGLDDEDRALMPERMKQELWERVRHWTDEANALATCTLEAHSYALEQLTTELQAADYVSGDRVKELLALYPALETPHQMPDITTPCESKGLAEAV